MLSLGELFGSDTRQSTFDGLQDVNLRRQKISTSPVTHRIRGLAGEGPRHLIREVTRFFRIFGQRTMQATKNDSSQQCCLFSSATLQSCTQTAYLIQRVRIISAFPKLSLWHFIVLMLGQNLTGQLHHRRMCGVGQFSLGDSNSHW
ncbi:hypothetical protein ASD72_16410 [Pseudoxanthomonas sp. Root630]|nr:hypothetical protein ASD72_16410 [Pseudoxanthomonas sp. Root630]